MNSSTPTECNINLGVEKELQGICYIDAVPCEQNGKASFTDHQESPVEDRKLKNFLKPSKTFCKNLLNYYIVESNMRTYDVLTTKRVLPGNLMQLVILKFEQSYVKDNED